MDLRNGPFLAVTPDKAGYEHQHKHCYKYDPACGKHTANIQLKVQLLFAGFKKNDKLHRLNSNFESRRWSMSKPLLIVILTLLVGTLAASRLEKGFEAMAGHDYFKARKLFFEINRSGPDAYASYGLATIFSRNDNPFFNLDSAGKYVRLSHNLFQAAPKMLKLAGIMVDGPAILSLADAIARDRLLGLKKENSAARLDRFLLDFIVSDKIRSEAVYLRDELEFNSVLSSNKSDSTEAFLLTHPESEFFMEAWLLRDRQLFDETTAPHTAGAYAFFLKKYPRNVMVNTAYEKLFLLHKKNADKNGLKDFVKTYPQAPQHLDAWKLIFTLSVKTFTSEEMTGFLAENPDFPLKNSILKELELNYLVLYPFHKNDDLAGFIDTTGKFAILPEYDAATDFYDGLAVVSKNDSVFFINKENVNPFHKRFAEAYVFHYGIAPVKQGNSWLFINRLGEAVSRPYDEINEFSDGAYVIRIGNKYGAVDQFGQLLLEPKFDKLGDFKNGFAYYVEAGRYGFVSRNGISHKAEFEWISDFDSSGVAVFKESAHYGLILSSGKKMLEADYDQILRGNSGIFIVASGSTYGFYSAGGCFLSPVMYDFAKDKTAGYYTDGHLLKLVRRGEQALMNKNGQVLLPFGSYAEVHFFSEGLMRIKKMVKGEGRYGYLDFRLNPIIAPKYEQAGNFADSLAQVELKDRFILVDRNGTEIFAADSPLEKVSPHYYRIEETKQLVNGRGEVVYNGVVAVKGLKSGLWAVVLTSGEIRLIQD